MQSWTRMSDKWHKLCKNKNTKYVSIPVGRKHFFGELYLRDDICKMKKEIFEGVEVHCPHNTDMYLTRLYGDYMVLPDDTQKEKHVYIKPFIL